MLFNLTFKTTILGMVQILILGGIGFLLIKRRFLGEEGLSVLSKLIIELTLPLLIFSQLIEGFSFSAYKDWWWFPLLSLAITLLGFGIGKLLVLTCPAIKDRKGFISLVGFQNSGYLPLVLIAAIFSASQAQQLFVYLFLFLLGFNLVVWSLGVWYLNCPSRGGVNALRQSSFKEITGLLGFQEKDCREILKFFSPPVLATVLSLLFVAFGINKGIPQAIIHPLKMIGECTMPLAMLVVGGNLAAIAINKIDKKAIYYLIFAKLVLLPLIALVIILFWRPNPLIGFLIIVQAAMPSATSLSVIARHYKVEEGIINQGILFTHLVSLVTIPLFLILFSTFSAAF